MRPASLPLRLDLIAEFRAWSKNMTLTELVLRMRNHPTYSSLTLDELKEVRRLADADAEAAIENVRQLAATAAELIATRAASQPPISARNARRLAKHKGSNDA